MDSKTTALLPKHWYIIAKFVGYVSSAMLVVVSISCSNPVQPKEQSLKNSFQYKYLIGQPDSLYPVFPNPFNLHGGDTSIAITFTKKDSSATTLLIQNPLGTEITGFTDTTLGPGVYRGSWAPLDATGAPLRSGLYFITLHSLQFVDSKLVNVINN